MTDLNRIYDRDFFAQWGSGNRAYVETARYIAGVLSREFSPKRIADIGSGCGVYSHAFRELGAEVLAIDGVSPPPEYSFPGEVHVRDLTEPVENSWGAFDLTLCLEVAEHIAEENVGVFLANIAKFSDLLIFSAAPPFQGGEHHVNERPKRYWRERLAGTGFSYNRPRTGVLSETFKRDKPQLMWMCQQISVYERRVAGKGL